MLKQIKSTIFSFNKIAKDFGMTIDELVYFDGTMPDVVTFENKTLMEQLKLIAEFEPEEKI